MTTNLATRPFRNERLPWLLSVLALVGSVLISIAHARVGAGLVGGDEAKTVRTVREDETRIADLEAKLGQEPPMRVPGPELATLRAFKGLVDRRVFPWRRLLSNLEGIAPDGVRLTRVQPDAGKDGQTLAGMVIRLTGESRTKDTVFSFAEALDADPAFSNSVLKSLNEGDGGTGFEIEVLFDPAPPRADLPPATPSAISVDGDRVR